MRSERERLLDILEAFERIERYAEEGKDVFESDELIQTWVVHHITIIGEACSKLPNEFQARYVNVPWADIIGMRNILFIIISGLIRTRFGPWWNVTCRS